MAFSSVFSVLTSFAQPANLQFESITTANGLSQDIVRCIHRDRLGFLWVGTEDGLNRYDGYSITVYKHHPGDSASLPSNWIVRICDYEDSDLLVLTMKGIAVYRRARDSFEPLPEIASIPRFAEYNNAVRDARGDYWMTRGVESVIRCSAGFRLLSEYDPRHLPDSSSMNTLYVDPRGRILVGARGAILIFDTSGAGPSVIPLHPPDLPASQTISVSCITGQEPGVLWLGTDYGLYRLDERTNGLRNIPLLPAGSGSILSRDMLFDLAWDTRGRLWAGGFNALYCYDPQRTRTLYYPEVQPHSAGSAGSRIYAVFVDSAEVLWAGTWGEGLQKANLHKEQFGLLRHSKRTPFAGGTSAIGTIFEDREGRIWLGDEASGVTILDSTLMPVERWDPGPLTAKRITAIAGDSLGNVWIASGYGVLDCYTPRTSKSRHFHFPPGGDPPPTVFTMAAGPDGRLWVGTESHGVYRVDPRTGRFEAFRGNAGDPPIPSAWSLLFDSGGNLWLGGWTSDARLHRVDGLTGEVRSYEQQELSAARSIVRAGDALWVGTWGNGLTRFDPRTGDLQNYTEKNGLPSNYVKGVLDDAGGALWVSTERGLCRLDPRSGLCRTYEISDGLQGIFFYSGSCLKSRSGRLFFGGPNGVNAFNPDSIHDLPFPAPVVLTGFRVFDRQRFFDRPLHLLGEIELGHDENLFAFEYVALDYRAPARQDYAYMMEGFDKEWIHAGSRRYVSYTHLDPGDYVFNVKATNSDGAWNPVPASIHLHIVPAFWQTWWFRWGVATLSALFIYGLYRYRLGKLLELERVRTAIATDLHDDIGTSLTNIALFSDLAQREFASGSAKAPDRLVKISQTSRALLDSMNDIVWSIKPENDGLEQTILRMEDYAVQILEENGIDLHVQIPEDSRSLRIPMSVRRNLFLIFKEAIGNVLKHSAATKVEVTITASQPRKRSRQLCLSITDNGKGFDSSRQSPGNGLPNMGRRVRLLGGAIDVRSAEGRGTTVEIRIPVKSPI